MDLLRPASQPEHPFRHGDLEPCPFSGLPGLPDAHAGDTKDLPHKEEAEARVPPEPAPEDMLLVCQRYADSVISDDENAVAVPLLKRDAHLSYMVPMPGRVVEQVEKHLFKHRVCKYLEWTGPDADTDAAEPAGPSNPPGNALHPLPVRGLHPQLLVKSGKRYLVIDNFYNFHQPVKISLNLRLSL